MVSFTDNPFISGLGPSVDLGALGSSAVGAAAQTISAQIGMETQDAALGLPGFNDALTSTMANTPTVPSNTYDLRARLRAKSAVLYQGVLGQVIQDNGGLVWPYTPIITYNQDVTYDSMAPVHSNQEILAYTRTPAAKLTVQGNFTAQTYEEGLYALACIQFLRVVTKMSFGASQTPQPGTPPPVLLFDAHGPGMFQSLPVVVTNFAVSIPNECDYINVAIPNSATSSAAPSLTAATRVPSFFDITVSITVQQTPKSLRAWSLDTFRNGGYIGGWI